jgi:hypothetical protein
MQFYWLLKYAYLALKEASRYLNASLAEDQVNVPNTEDSDTDLKINYEYVKTA